MRLREQYCSAVPFPHVVIDDFFPQEILEAIIGDFPKPGEIDWNEFANREEKKLASTAETQKRLRMSTGRCSRRGQMKNLAAYLTSSGRFSSSTQTTVGTSTLNLSRRLATNLMTLPAVRKP